MSQLESKLEKALFELLKAKGFVTLEALSKSCGVTRRSVQNHLIRLEKWFDDNNFSGATLIKKPGKGISLSISPDTFAALKKLLADDVILFDDFSRRLRFLKLLLFSKEEFTIGFLSDFFYCSRTVILRDMDWISNWMKKFGLQLSKVQNKGIKISGSEIYKRNAIAAFFDIYQKDDFSESWEILQSTTRIPEQVVLRFKSLYPEIDIFSVASIIEDAEEHFDFFLTNEYFVSLLTHMVICVSRLQSENLTEDYDETEDYAPVRKIAEYITGKMCDLFRIDFLRSEVDYVCLHLMSYSINDAMDDIRRKTGVDVNLEALAISTIEFVEKKIGGTFLTDKILYFGILCHLETSKYRIKNKIYIGQGYENRANLDMKIFDAVKQCDFLYKTVYGESFIMPDEEAEAITLYFMLSWNRMRQKFRAVLLHSSGIALGTSLKEYLVAEIEELEIIDIVSQLFQLDLIPELRYDFIISTQSLDKCSKPAVLLQNLPKHEYKGLIQDFLKNI